MRFLGKSAPLPGPIPGDTSLQLADIQDRLRDLIARLPAAVPDAEPDTDSDRTLSPDDWSEINQVLFRKLQLPWIEDLIGLADRLDQVVADTRARTVEDLMAFIESLRGEVLNNLDNQGIKRIETLGPYDRTLHKATSTFETGNRDLADGINKCIRTGYVRHGTVLRKAEVEVWKLRSQGEPTP